LGLVNPGDEVILFEPAYDSYLPCVQFAGGVPRFYTLRPPNWGIDWAELESLFNERTKLIVVNTPHNPTGKVFTAVELHHIAQLCQKYDVLALADAVYEHIVFAGATHIPLAALPGMRERTVTLSSVGKTFSVTGWKTGWVLAPPELTTAVRRIHQYLTFAIVTPMQHATAQALAIAAQNGYYQEVASSYQARRDLLAQALHEAGLKPLLPQGSYFIMADITGLPFANDVAFCHYLTREVGVAAIPPSAFYHNPADGASLVRFAFCKDTAVLQAAASKLKALSRKL
jgi:aspartate/methionine/tyrosine aminotransferase